ncbi:hypothetical protein CWE12_10690 [Aliidiomarina sedimenti]|uniref:MarR family transcriptional regulator n=1 Tax=Aliidiomarina sedimenti TaxID=1933879 RepID=A0ABY0BWJ8_9GAMM|nr:hypothetical protein [Aliidiomarina sedimenti]RUO28773.1 hypothetical protein CWE12_10690 [Aliidiomarina sedimenti]
MNNTKLNFADCKASMDYPPTQLMRVARTSRECRILMLVWEHQGILTHELGEKFGYKSNNHHNVTQAFNPRIIRLGWVISKYRSGQPSESWRWYLEPVYIALQKPIRKDLRRTIRKHMEAANQ